MSLQGGEVEICPRDRKSGGVPTRGEVRSSSEASGSEESDTVNRI